MNNMNNELVIRNFLRGLDGQTPMRDVANGYYTYKGRTLYTRENYLINYATRIAKLEGNVVYLNIKKYSVTTSKIQNKIRSLVEAYGLQLVEVEGEM
jgi:hypothetical protein